MRSPLAVFPGNEPIVLRDPASSQYRLGPRAIELGLRAVGAADIRALALPFMFALRDATDETVTLSLRVGHERTFLNQVRNEQEVRMLVDFGTRLPLYAGAPRLAILAFLPEDELAARGRAAYAPDPCHDHRRAAPADVARAHPRTRLCDQRGRAQPLGERRRRPHPFA